LSAPVPYTEETSTDEISKIHETIIEAKKMVFLGFGFLDLNMDLLQWDQGKDQRTKSFPCYASVYDISVSNQDKIRQRLRSLTKGESYLGDKKLKCREFFDDYKFSLAI